MIYAIDSIYYHSFLRNSGVYRYYSGDEEEDYRRRGTSNFKNSTSEYW